MMINDLALIEDCEPEDWEYVVTASVLHELAHILDRPTLVEDRTGVDPNRLLFEALVVANSLKRPLSCDLPAYHGHGASFIRLTLHLCQRAALAGVDVRPAAICGGRRYGLSHASDYQDALGDEPTRCLGMSFRAIAATPPPASFSRLWQEDVVLYYRRFPHLKGASV